MPTLVPDKLTPLSLEEAIRGFADGWSIALRRDPSPRGLATLVAHTILECGDGYKSLHWFNFGNEKASPQYSGQYCMYRCNEVIDGVVQWFNPPHPQTWFRAFESAAAGACEHVIFLSSDSDGDGKNRYAEAWKRCEAGDPDGFVHALKTAGYFTGPADSYARAVVSIANKIQPACDRILSSQHHGITEDDISRVSQMVTLWLSEQPRAFTEPFPLPEGDS